MTSNRDFKKNVVGFVPDAFSILQSYHWPGNIRELRNTVERAVLLSVGDRLDENDLPHELRKGIGATEPGSARLLQALERTGGNQTQAAKLLGINRDQIRYRMEKFKLSR